MNLTGIPALDVAIGLSFVFLVLSLFASAVQEWIAALLQLRAKTLKQGLESMLGADTVSSKGLPLLAEQSAAAPGIGSPAAQLVATTVAAASPAGAPQTSTGSGAAAAPEAGAGAAPETGADATKAAGAGAAPEDDNVLVDLFYAHPLIRSLYKSPTKPAMPTDVKGLGRLPSYISPHSFAVALRDILGLQQEVKGLEARVEDLDIPASVKQRLLTLIRQSDDDVIKFQAQLEKWFDDTMARVSGWYKRQTQWILVVIGLIVTLILNANALTMGETLWKDPTVRAAVVAQATSGTVTGQTSGSNATDRLKNAASNVAAVPQLGVPLGWPAKSSDPAHVRFDSVRAWVRNLVGWILTIAAISLGAPFWFDSLGRLARLRSSGKPETPLPATGAGKPNERVPVPAKTA